jgi:hypothetical protein
MLPSMMNRFSGILLRLRCGWCLSDVHDADIKHSLLAQLHNQLIKRVVFVQHLLIFHIRVLAMTLLTHHHLSCISLQIVNSTVFIKPSVKKKKKNDKKKKR